MYQGNFLKVPQQQESVNRKILDLDLSFDDDFLMNMVQNIEATGDVPQFRKPDITQQQKQPVGINMTTISSNPLPPQSQEKTFDRIQDRSFDCNNLNSSNLNINSAIGSDISNGNDHIYPDNLFTPATMNNFSDPSAPLIPSGYQGPILATHPTNFDPRNKLDKPSLEKPPMMEKRMHDKGNNYQAVQQQAPKNRHEYRSHSWTEEEDEKLREGIKKFGYDWTTIAEFVGNKRSRSQCSQRWSRVLDPDISREPWSEAEEALLLQLVQIHGDKSWKALAEHMPNRNDSQCRFHYLHMQKENENIHRALQKETKFLRNEKKQKSNDSSYVDPHQTNATNEESNTENAINEYSSQSDSDFFEATISTGSHSKANSQENYQEEKKVQLPGMSLPWKTNVTW
ncbi:hypothetical protein TRFO_26897 [Tritrichomonas foetus]|uniref:Myb-like DNA-binding domain containing protein n=1 Tax=Tritrichomonas foetus TaxID=1144522 RepID=A0A1J4K6Q8_9EUKA|nr:hypothetical protein TRFO_26897 [Tritrichomonas foetus]|eukprot:OHT05412.1 hypothetical protein TRFO_26897 [Tritrichomonas foetus]